MVLSSSHECPSSLDLWCQTVLSSAWLCLCSRWHFAATTHFLSRVLLGAVRPVLTSCHEPVQTKLIWQLQWRSLTLVQPDNTAQDWCPQCRLLSFQSSFLLQAPFLVVLTKQRERMAVCGTHHLLWVWLLLTGEISPNKTSSQGSAVRRKLNTKPQSWCHVFGDQPTEPKGRRCVTLLMCDCKHICVSHQVTSCLHVRGLHEARSLFTQLCPKEHQTDFRANKKLL